MPMQPQCHLDKPVAYASPKNLSSIKLICWELQILLAPYLLNQNHTNVITQKTWKNPIQNPNSWNLKNKRSDWKGTLTKRSKVLKILMHACVFFEEDLERLVTLMRLCLRNEERFEEAVGADSDVGDDSFGLSELVHCLSHLLRRCLGRNRSG